MTGTRSFDTPDTTSGVLESLRARQSVVDRAEAEKLQLAVAWATMHCADSIVGPVTEWSEHAIPLGGPGSPEVAEFCVAELAAALGMSPHAGRAYLADAIEIAHRLPRVYARVRSGSLPVWRARRIAQTTLCLSQPAAGFVDTHVAPVAHSVTVPALDRLVEEAMVRFDPEAAERARLAAAEGRCFDIHLRDTDATGVVAVSGLLDYADARDLDAALAQGAAEQAALGSIESLDVRRSVAAGDLARRQLTLDLNPDQTGRRTKARQVVIHVHLSDASIARVEELGAAGGLVMVDQVKDWCQATDTQVVIKPVIDLNEHLHADSYEIPDRIRDHVVLRDRTCIFPGCTRNARRCDLDHRIPWDEGGATATGNTTSL